jgi:hypothetical protein
MEYQTTRTIPASAARGWAVLSAVERWPEWIGVYESVRRIDAGPLAVGSVAEVRQRGLRAGAWRVTELTDGRGFTWENQQPGVHTVARHAIAERPAGRIELLLTLEQTGWLSGLVGLLMGGKVRRYVDAEADALAAVAAGPGAAPSAAR